MTNVQAIKKGAGAKNEEILFTKGNDTTNHVIHQDSADELCSDRYEAIEIIPLDSLNTLGETITLLKIDVEGMEESVLKGAHNLLQSEALNVVILETFGSGTLHETMLNYGFQLCTYNPENRELKECVTDKTLNNGIYVKNLVLARERLEKKRRYKILGVAI